jgi:hypothetical protein
MYNANNRDRWWRLSKFYRTARKKADHITLTGVAYKKTLYRDRITYYLTCRPVCSHRVEHAIGPRLLMMQCITYDQYNYTKYQKGKVDVFCNNNTTISCIEGNEVPLCNV